MPDRAVGDLADTLRLDRRTLFRAALGTTGLLLLTACAGAPPLPRPLERFQNATVTPVPSPVAAAPTEVSALPAVASPSPVVASTPLATPLPRPAVNLSGVTLAYLGGASFVPAADAFLKRQIEDWMRETGARVTIEIVNPSDIQPRLAAAIQAGTGPDVVQLRDNWAQSYRAGLADLSDLVEELRRVYGDLYPIFEANLRGPEGTWHGLPHSNTGDVLHWRQSWFRDAGSATFPDRLDAYHDVGKRLKANGRPFGQAIGHSFADAPGWCYGMLWSYGGREVDGQGKVAINSQETLQAVRDATQAFRDAYDERGLGWDDGANNRAFLAESISSTQNGSSIWFAARSNGVPFLNDVGLALMPAGPRGRALLASTAHYGIPRYSQRADAAKELLRYLMRPGVYEARFLENQGSIAGISPKHDQTLPWDRLPAPLRVFREVGQYARAVGFPGPASEKAGLAWSRYVIVDMFTRAIQGDSAESAVGWAESELRSIYET